MIPRQSVFHAEVWQGGASGYVRTYVPTYLRTYVRTYIRTYCMTLNKRSPPLLLRSPWKGGLMFRSPPQPSEDLGQDLGQARVFAINFEVACTPSE